MFEVLPDQPEDPALELIEEPNDALAKEPVDDEVGAKIGEDSMEEVAVELIQVIEDEAVETLGEEPDEKMADDPEEKTEDEELDADATEPTLAVSLEKADDHAAAVELPDDSVPLEPPTVTVTVASVLHAEAVESMADDEAVGREKEADSGLEVVLLPASEVSTVETSAVGLLELRLDMMLLKMLGW